MQAGKLRHRIDIERNTPTLNSLNEPVQAWAAVYPSVACSLEPLNGKELFSAQQFNAQVTHKVTMRGGKTITAADRIKFGARVFEITSVINKDERGIETEIMCFERADRASQ